MVSATYHYDFALCKEPINRLRRCQPYGWIQNNGNITKHIGTRYNMEAFLGGIGFNSYTSLIRGPNFGPCFEKKSIWCIRIAKHIQNSLIVRITEHIIQISLLMIYSPENLFLNMARITNLLIGAEWWIYASATFTIIYSYNGLSPVR